MFSSLPVHAGLNGAGVSLHGAPSLPLLNKTQYASHRLINTHRLAPVWADNQKLIKIQS